MQELHITPNKLMGQNFLLSGQVAERIVGAARLPDTARVVEIGPGLGALSEPLAQEASALTLVELDERLAAYLRRRFADYPHIQIVNADAMSFDYAAHAAERGWCDYQVAANLPYYITSPLIRRLLLTGGPWQTMTLLLQKETAQKLAAPSQGGAGDPLSLLLQYFGVASLEFTLPPESFYPAPAVQSAVLRVERRDKPLLEIEDTEHFARFLNAAFAQRRKTLANSLSGALSGDKELWRRAIIQCGLAEHCRAEQLTLQGFGALYALSQVEGLLPKSD